MNRIVLKVVSENDCRDIWLWRNHPDVRKGFFNPEPVLWQEHTKWFVSKIKTPNTKIYIATSCKDKIGVIRFETGKDCVNVSVNLNPAFFGKGLGSKIIKLGTERFCQDTEVNKHIIAEIKKDNIASQKAFANAGYEIMKENERVVIYEKRC